GHSSARQVGSSIAPLGTRPWCAWNARTASTVSGPYVPSTSTVPPRCCWAQTTRSPASLDPTSGYSGVALARDERLNPSPWLSPSGLPTQRHPLPLLSFHDPQLNAPSA